MLSVQRQTKIKPDQLNQPEFPKTLAKVWDYFWELIGERQSGMGLNPISYTEIAAWNELTGAGVTPQEVKIIKALDRAYLFHYSKKMK